MTTERRIVMSRSKQVSVYPKEARHVVAHLKDFEGDSQDWRNAFYELWRYQMTWSFAHKIIVSESRKNGVFVSLTIRGYEDVLLSTMEGLGYRNVKVTDETIGVADDAVEFDGDYVDIIEFDF